MNKKLITIIISSIWSLYGAHDDMVQDIHNILTPQGSQILSAFVQVNNAIEAQPENNPFRTFQTLIKMLEKKQSSTVIPEMKPGSIMLMVKQAGHGFNRYLAAVAKELDAECKEILASLLTDLQQISRHLEQYIKTENPAIKEKIADHIVNMIHTILTLVDQEFALQIAAYEFETTPLDFLHHFNNLLPNIIDALKERMQTHAQAKQPAAFLKDQELDHFFTSHGVAILETLIDLFEDEVGDFYDEQAENNIYNDKQNISAFEIIKLFSGRVPRMMYEATAHLTYEQTSILLESITKIYAVAQAAEQYIMTENQSCKETRNKAFGELIKYFIINWFKLPPLPKRAAIVVNAINQEFPQFIRRFKTTTTSTQNASVTTHTNQA